MPFAEDRSFMFFYVGTTMTKSLLFIAILFLSLNTYGAEFLFSWTAPTQREDSSSLLLSEIAGYRIYYGTTSKDYTNSIFVSNSSATNYLVTGLTGKNYFVITTIDTDGRESLYSSEFTTKFPMPPTSIIVTKLPGKPSEGRGAEIKTAAIEEKDNDVINEINKEMVGS
jgi:hypothetical protein